MFEICYHSNSYSLVHRAAILATRLGNKGAGKVPVSVSCITVQKDSGEFQHHIYTTDRSSNHHVFVYDSSLPFPGKALVLSETTYNSCFSESDYAQKALTTYASNTYEVHNGY